MIRERREEDLDRLCAILKTMKYPSSFLSGEDLREWLKEHDAEQSWVFDMAPVRVAPTKNVVGHVQIYSPTKDSSTPYLVKYTEKPASNLLAIGKLFVKPNTHEYGIGKYLLKESINYIQGQGKLPVLDFHGNGFLSKRFCEKFGFGDPFREPWRCSNDLHQVIHEKFRVTLGAGGRCPSPLHAGWHRPPLTRDMSTRGRSSRICCYSLLTGRDGS